jgi:hypothetical protein
MTVDDGPDTAPRPGRFRVLSVLLIVTGAVVGVGLIALAVAVGDCSAFGGRCPSEPPPIPVDDTFRLAGLGAALVVAPGIYLSRPSWRRLGLAVAVGAAAGVVVGAIARASIST